MTSVRIIGNGRAGGAFAHALATSGWSVDGPLGRSSSLAGAAHGADLLLLCVSDAAIAEVASAVEPDEACVVAHVSGAVGLEALAAHPRVGAVHPLVSLATPEAGSQRLRDGAWFAISGDPLMATVVATLHGRAFEIADEHRALYHAAACIASNHLVALLGQTERVAAAAGAPFEAYLDLVRGTVENVASLGPRAALTGPAARGDAATLERHRTALAQLDPHELATYDAMMHEARRLAGREA